MIVENGERVTAARGHREVPFEVHLPEPVRSLVLEALPVAGHSVFGLIAKRRHNCRRLAPSTFDSVTNSKRRDLGEASCQGMMSPPFGGRSDPRDVLPMSPNTRYHVPVCTLKHIP